MRDICELYALTCVCWGTQLTLTCSKVCSFMYSQYSSMFEATCDIKMYGGRWYQFFWKWKMTSFFINQIRPNLWWNGRLPQSSCECNEWILCSFIITFNSGKMTNTTTKNILAQLKKQKPNQWLWHNSKLT